MSDEVSRALESVLSRWRQDLLAEVDVRINAAVQGAAEAAPPPPTMRIGEACELFRVSRSSFDRWLADGRSGLRQILVPVGERGWLVPRDEFLSWLLARRGHTQAKVKPLPTSGSQLAG